MTKKKAWTDFINEVGRRFYAYDKLIADRDALLNAAKKCDGFGPWAEMQGNLLLADALSNLRAAIRQAGVK